MKALMLLMLYDDILNRDDFYRLKLQISNILCQIACRTKILVIQIMKLLWLHLNSSMVSLTIKGFHVISLNLLSWVIF